MSDYKSAVAIIACIGYFIVFFLIIASVDVGVTAVSGVSNSIRYTNPGFQDQFNVYDKEAECIGTVKKNILNKWYCAQFNNPDPYTALNTISEAECYALPGCEYQNATVLFNITVFQGECTGSLNITALGLEENTTTFTFCPQLTNQETCEQLNCDWLDAEAVTQRSLDELQGTSFFSVLWNNIKFVATFRADFDLGAYNWIISLFLFYLPLLLLIISIIYAVLPF